MILQVSKKTNRIILENKDQRQQQTTTQLQAVGEETVKYWNAAGLLSAVENFDDSLHSSGKS
jgi:hypothetical protein